MPIQRFYVDIELCEHQQVSIADKEFLHIVNVMRNKQGSLIEIINGRNQLASSVIEKIEKKYIFLRIQKLVTREIREHIVLYQALTSSQHLDYIIEKGTEVGVTCFYLFPGDRSVKTQISPEKTERLKLITVASMKQCGRLDLPDISFISSIKTWEKEGIVIPLFFGDPSPSAPKLKDFLLHKKSYFSYVIGPEGGFSDQELALMKKLNISGVNIHPFTLRAETAAVAFATLIKHFNY